MSKELKVKNDLVSDLKEKLKDEREKYEEKIKKLKKYELNEEAKTASFEARVLYNSLKLKEDEKKFRKNLRKSIKENLEKERNLLIKKEDFSMRAINFLAKKINLIQPYMVEEYDKEIILSMVEELSNIFNEESKKSFKKVFDIKELIKHKK